MVDAKYLIPKRSIESFDYSLNFEQHALIMFKKWRDQILEFLEANPFLYINKIERNKYKDFCIEFRIRNDDISHKELAPILRVELGYLKESFHWTFLLSKAYNNFVKDIDLVEPVYYFAESFKDSFFTTSIKHHIEDKYKNCCWVNKQFSD